MKTIIQELPLSPGVYLMRDSRGTVIYVGKSKSLKKRVQSYFYNNKSHSPKVKKLVHHVKDLEHIVTDTEFEAFMLECRLIQDIKPMYNRKMKNPLGYSYIVLRQKGDWRWLEITDTLDDGGQDRSRFFGPYTASRKSLEHALARIEECCKIACNHRPAAASANTPCLNYSLGLCLGKCLGGANARRFDEVMDRFIGLLQGNDRSLYDEMEHKMVEAAERFDFEQAAKYRDGMEAVNLLLSKRQVIEFAAENHSIVVYEHLDKDTIKLFLIKGNVVLHSERCSVAARADIESLQQRAKALILSYFTKDTEPDAAEITREDIDAVQIIYSYLQSSACRYLLIPGSWVEADEQSELEAALREFWA
ncbi:GIY-YIG nuclease family protein [Paenibacillus humicus]|uniref:GIY-YIG nuclease family protein n=1 Tax=Paenibacillus humicus TaxID=412861 RepID=UPI003D290941